MNSTSTWFALRNPTFLRIWLATVFSATFLAAQDVTATWLLHDLGASFSLSLMATATSTPLLLFALPAGIIADTVNRRNVVLSAMAGLNLKPQFFTQIKLDGLSCLRVDKQSKNNRLGISSLLAKALRRSDLPLPVVTTV